jgi:5-methylthioribose kinase
MNNLIALEDLGKSNDYTILYDLKQKYKRELAVG